MDRLPVEIFLQILHCLPLPDRVKHKLVARSWKAAISVIPIHLSPIVKMKVPLEHTGCFRLTSVGSLLKDRFSVDSLCKGADLFVELQVECHNVDAQYLKKELFKYFKTENIIFDRWLVIPSEMGLVYEDLLDELKAGLILTHGTLVRGYLETNQVNNDRLIVSEELDVDDRVVSIEYGHADAIEPNTFNRQYTFPKIKNVSVSRKYADDIGILFEHLHGCTDMPNLESLSLSTCSCSYEELPMQRPFIESIIAFKSLKNLCLSAFSDEAFWSTNDMNVDGEDDASFSETDPRTLILIHILSCLNLETISITNVEDFNLDVYLNTQVLSSIKPSLKEFQVDCLISVPACFEQRLVEAVEPLVECAQDHRKLDFEFRKMEEYQEQIDYIVKMNSIKSHSEILPLKIVIANKGPSLVED